MARSKRKSGVKAAKEVALSDQGRFVPLFREAETQEIVITRHGKPAGVLIGFETEEDWFDYRLQNDPCSCAGSSRRAAACLPDAG